MVLDIGIRLACLPQRIGECKSRFDMSGGPAAGIYTLGP